jgi:indoleamine 2,3-dioxygenase
MARNLRMLHTFTGTRDEAWFLLISLGVEARGGPILSAIMSSMRAMRSGNENLLLDSFRALEKELHAIRLILERMPDKVCLLGILHVKSTL